MCRLINSDVRESFAAKLRNKSPERSAEYCRVKTLCRAFHFAERSQEHQGNIRCGFNSDSSYKNWEQIAKAFVCQCWVELQHQGNTMRPTTACVPIQTEKRIARAFFARQCGIELQHQRECGFNSIGFYFNTHRRYAGSYFYFCGSFSFPLISTLASWRARSTNTGPAETYVHIWYRKLRLRNSIRNECLRMVVQYYIFLSDCTFRF